MLEATWWGFVGGTALLLGALSGIFLPLSHRFIGLVLGFGTGVLVSALAFELVGEAYDSAGAPATVLGLLAGSLVFFAGDWWIDARGGHGRKSPRGVAPGAASSALVLGALLDGIPESAAIGVSLIDGGSVGVTVVAAVFLSNVPEAMSASAGMKSEGRATRSILLLWGAVAGAGTIASALGFALLGGAPEGAIAVTMAFAAGAILTMLVDTMVPEAVRHAGRLVGLVTALGFVAAFLLSHA
ncbi:MAG: ZIP family zinc transporter [Nocardioidaceae bacterium]|nr:ZIP family zinc transporter [Nocardioidaceae bacterium]